MFKNCRLYKWQNSPTIVCTNCTLKSRKVLSYYELGNRWVRGSGRSWSQEVTTVLVGVIHPNCGSLQLPNGNALEPASALWPCYHRTLQYHPHRRHEYLLLHKHTVTYKHHTVCRSHFGEVYIDCVEVGLTEWRWHHQGVTERQTCFSSLWLQKWATLHEPLFCQN